jgi:tRNA(Arg) A34 adenosine deaminase TadA
MSMSQPCEAQPPSRFAVVDDVDVAHLRRCLELARRARDGGNEPFGSLLVNRDGEVVAELMNTVGGGDITGHPELALAAWASLHMTAAEREEATLYTSCESCAMCAGAHYWAGIGRLVFAVSGDQLADIVSPGGRSLRLSSREVFARGNARIEVEGPCDQLLADARSVFDGFWS